MINDYWYHAYSNEYNVSFQGYSPLGSPGTTSIKGDVLKNPVLALVAEKLGKTPAQVALRWGLQSGHTVLPKSTKEARIKENFDVFDWSIPEDLVSKFSELKQACLALFFITSLFSFSVPEFPSCINYEGDLTSFDQISVLLIYIQCIWIYEALGIASLQLYGHLCMYLVFSHCKYSLFLICRRGYLKALDS